MIETEPPLQKLYYRPGELAKLLDEPVRNVYAWIRSGKIRAMRIGKCYKIHRGEVERVLGVGSLG